MIPAGRHSHSRVVEVGVRCRIQRPGQPVAEENSCKCDPLPARAKVRNQEGKGVTEADLAQRVGELEVGHGAAGGRKEDPQRYENETAPDGMAQHALEGGAFLLAASQRVGKRDADQECEARLDGVVQAHAGPLGVGLVEAQKLPNGIVGERLCYVRQLQDFRHHQQHDQAAVSVDGYISLQLLFHTHDRFAHWPTLRGDFFICLAADTKES